MKKTLLAISLLMSLCSAAHAEWVKVFENIRGTFFYMDPATVENHGRGACGRCRRIATHRPRACCR